MKVNNGYFVQNLKTVDKRILDNLFRLSAKVYNQALYFHKNYYEQYSRFPTWNIVADELKETNNFKLLGNAIAVSVIRNLDINYKNYFKNSRKEGNLKPPNYRKRDFFISFFGRSMFNVLQDGTLTIYLSKDFQRKYNCSSFQNIKIPKNFKEASNTKQIRLEEKNGNYRLIYTYPVKEVAIKKTGTKMSVDLGMNQLFACYFYNPNKALRPVLVSGRRIKSINHHLLKKSELLKRDTDKVHLKRINKIENEINKYVSYLFKLAISRGVDEIYVGFFKDIKENKVARHFFYIPHSKIRRKIRDYGIKYGIKTVFDDESYTSKTSFLDFESPEKQNKYLGKRVERGLFKSKDGTVINADLNGAGQIMVKLGKIEINNRENVKLVPISVKN